MRWIGVWYYTTTKRPKKILGLGDGIVQPFLGSQGQACHTSRNFSNKFHKFGPLGAGSTAAIWILVFVRYFATKVWIRRIKRCRTYQVWYEVTHYNILRTKSANRTISAKSEGTRGCVVCGCLRVCAFSTENLKPENPIPLSLRTPYNTITRTGIKSKITPTRRFSESIFSETSGAHTTKIAPLFGKISSKFFHKLMHRSPLFPLFSPLSRKPASKPVRGGVISKPKGCDIVTRFGNKLLLIQVFCPRNGAAQKGSSVSY